MTQETKDGNSPPQQIVSDHEWSVWINNSKITGDTLNRVQKHIQETEMSKWLAANRKHGREPGLSLHLNSLSTQRPLQTLGRTSCTGNGNGL
jgi:hypothetical protein